MTVDVGRPPRWLALDAFRGIAVIGMLLVNNPGNHDAVYAPLRHSAWHGCTPADLVFPFFLFVVGITTELAGARDTGRIVRRALLIFAAGLLLHWFPFYQSGPIAWSDHPGVLDRLVGRLYVLRIPGVLQRIAVTYLAAALLARRFGWRALAGLTLAILVGYWLLLTVVPVPGEGAAGALLLGEPSRTIVAHTDRALFDWTRWGLGNHLWDTEGSWDPEGLLSTIPAVATVLCGVLAGRWIRGDSMRAAASRTVIAGAALTGAGLLWGLEFPLNKSLWTSSFVLFTAGVALLVLAALSRAMRDGRAPWWSKPLVTFGQNPLIAYVGSELARRILHSTIKLRYDGRRLGVDELVTRMLQLTGLDARAASLGWALLFVVAWYLALARLSRQRLFLRA